MIPFFNDPVNLGFMVAYIMGSIAYLVSLLKIRKKKQRNKKHSAKEKTEFKPKLKMEDFPHV